MKAVATLAIVLVLAACGSTSSASNPSPSPAASPSAAASPSPVSGSGSLTGAMGDTKTNPDQTYGCAFTGLGNDSSDSNTTVVIVTVAGPSPNSLCPLFSALTNYTQVQSVTVNHSAVVCYMTSADGGATARFYTAPTGTLAQAKSVCSWELQDASAPS